MKKIIYGIIGLMLTVAPKISGADYTPMEAIPGSGKPATFPAYIVAIINLLFGGLESLHY